MEMMLDRWFDYIITSIANYAERRIDKELLQLLHVQSAEDNEAFSVLPVDIQ
jgi:hypothetical protein